MHESKNNVLKHDVETMSTFFVVLSCDEGILENVGK